MGSETGVTMEGYGYCPVQADGTVDGVEFYFRARGTRWAFGAGKDPVGVVCGAAPGFLRTGEHTDPDCPTDRFAAGYMPTDEANRIIAQCIAEFRATPTPAAP